MPGYSPKVPLIYDTAHGSGYALNTKMRDVIKQNMKMLVLTAPGERIMDTGFGVGLRNYLFESNSGETYSAIKGKIQEQIKRYMPHVSLLGIIINPLDEYSINVDIRYHVPSLSLSDNLDISVNSSLRN